MTLKSLIISPEGTKGRLFTLGPASAVALLLAILALTDRSLAPRRRTCRVTLALLIPVVGRTE